MTDDEIDKAILGLLSPGRERKVAMVIAMVAEMAGRDEEPFLLRVEAAIKRLTSMKNWRHGVMFRSGGTAKYA